MNTRLCLLAGLHVLAGCSFERTPAASPFVDATSRAPDASESAAGSAANRGPAAHDGGSSSGQAGAVAPPSAGAGGASGTAPSGAGGDADDPGHPDASPDAHVTPGCARPDVATCNPVTNDGCLAELQQQCAADLLSDTLAGYCIFSAPAPAPDGSCLNTGVTESCPPTQTCVDGLCRALCFCDDDCEEGRCCADPVGDHGFKACGDC
jgi:hypothetical protein